MKCPRRPTIDNLYRCSETTIIKVTMHLPNNGADHQDREIRNDPITRTEAVRIHLGSTPRAETGLGDLGMRPSYSSSEKSLYEAVWSSFSR
jgi:hypothetical protein